MTARETAGRTRLEAAFCGTPSAADSTDEEAHLFDAEVEARIEENLVAVRYGDVLAAEGVRIVALDADGRLVHYRPDGSAVLLHGAAAGACARATRR